MSTQDFTPKVTYEQGLKMAVETGMRGEAPSGNNLDWFLGGKWVSVVTDGLPSLYDDQAIIFPPGHAGRRSMNQQPPVIGRQWSGGEINANVTEEFIGHWVYGALGAASHNSIPSTSASLLAASRIESDTQQISLTVQPSNSGAVLQIRKSGTAASGRLTVAGVDSHGNNASETITFADTAIMYTRTSFSSVTGIQINSMQALGGSIAVNGFKYWEHIFFTATSNPTFSAERIGDPTAGAASKSFMHPGMVIQSLTINTPANSEDGIVSANSTWQGDPTATCTAGSLMEASGIRLWPAWILSLTRDGTAYTRPTNLSVSINSGNRNYLSAAGVQAPQGTFFGAREVTGSLDLLLSDETEFNRWRGASKQNLVATWTTPWKLTGTENTLMNASMVGAYMENIDTGDDDGAYTYAADFRTVVGDTTNDALRVLLRTRIPAEAYGGSTVIGA